jgi:hypothetical protein
MILQPPHQWTSFTAVWALYMHLKFNSYPSLVFEVHGTSLSTLYFNFCQLLPQVCIHYHYPFCGAKEVKIHLTNCCLNDVLRNQINDWSFYLFGDEQDNIPQSTHNFSFSISRHVKSKQLKYMVAPCKLWNKQLNKILPYPTLKLSLSCGYTVIF